MDVVSDREWRASLQDRSSERLLLRQSMLSAVPAGKDHEGGTRPLLIGWSRQTSTQVVFNTLADCYYRKTGVCERIAGAGKWSSFLKWRDS